MSSVILQRLSRFLSASEARSDEAIAKQLDCSRSAVWKHVSELRQLGIEIGTVTGNRFLLKEPLELLDGAVILAGLKPAIRDIVTNLSIEPSLDSTNSALQRLPFEQQHAAVILAEHQSGGRGRRGRQWISPYGKNLYLSIGWRFECSMPELACLPLVVALAAANALTRAGLEGHRVKWPNDLLLDGRKFCGCLVELQGDSHGPCHAVVGVGINIHMPASPLTTAIDQAWTDLHSRLPLCSRNELAVLLLQELVNQLTLFAGAGFAPFRDQWQQMDGLCGQTINATVGSNRVRGIAKGIDERGALLVDTGNQVLSLYSGEVTLHKPPI